MSFHIITDGSVDLIGGVSEDIIRVPINVSVGDEEFQYPGSITKEDALEKIVKLKPGKVRTSQPSPKQIISALEGLKGDVLYIALSSGLSGLYNSAMVAKNILKPKGIHLHVFDSKSVGPGIGLLVKEALRLRDEGKTIDETIAELEKYRERIRIYFAVPTLDYLVANGRLDPFKAALAKIVGVRPILTIEGGRVDLATTVRKNKLWSEMAALAKTKKVYLAYAPEGDDGKSLEEHLKYRDIGIVEKILLNPVIIVHAGPGTVGFMYIEEESDGNGKGAKESRKDT